MRWTCGSRSDRPLCLHRDMNAARDILAVYLSLAYAKKRLLAMARDRTKTLHENDARAICRSLRTWVRRDIVEEASHRLLAARRA